MKNGIGKAGILFFLTAVTGLTAGYFLTRAGIVRFVFPFGGNVLPPGADGAADGLRVFTGTYRILSVFLGIALGSFICFLSGFTLFQGTASGLTLLLLGLVTGSTVSSEGTCPGGIAAYGLMFASAVLTATAAAVFRSGVRNVPSDARRLIRTGEARTYLSGYFLLCGVILLTSALMVSLGIGADRNIL